MSYYEEDYYDDDEFYDESSGFEVAIEEFKRMLMQNVKEEFLQEMEFLRKENAELQEVKDNWEKIQRDYKRKESELESRKYSLINEVRRERLSQLMKDFEVVMYKVVAKYESADKCNKCNDYRHIHYKTPSGKDAYENCECNKKNTIYVPEQFVCTEFKINDGRNGLTAWYKMNKANNYDYASYDSVNKKYTYNGSMKYEDIDYLFTFFMAEEECQKYCDWLNDNNQ